MSGFVAVRDNVVVGSIVALVDMHIIRTFWKILKSYFLPIYLLLYRT